MLINKLDNMTQGPQIELSSPNTTVTSYFHMNNQIKGINFNGTGSYSLSDNDLTNQLNRKLNIVEEKLKLTMDEIVQACQEKYPYKFI